MRAIDTNVVVRFLTNDNPEQGARARRVVEGGNIFIAITVLLETEWVLRSLYGLTASEVLEKLRKIAGLPGTAIEDPPRLMRALNWAEAGVDFADALHLARASGCEAFFSFDRKLLKSAARLADVKVVEP